MTQNIYSKETIQAVSNYLSVYKCDIEELVEINFPDNEFRKCTEKLCEGKFIDSEKKSELDGLGYLDKQLALRELVRGFLHNFQGQRFIDLCCWVIETWGGIKSRNNRQFIEQYFSKDKGTYNDLPFDRIASSSKVASFLDPETYVVYDSRVAHALNWILLAASEVGNQFFPVPEGRNSKLIAFDIKVLIRLFNIENYRSKGELDRRFVRNMDKKLFITEASAYKELNILLTKVSEKLWPEDKHRLLKTEILLFCIADNQIFSDIVENVGQKLEKREIDNE